ncbi:MAG: glycosyltransferase [Kiritimatiellae bacterium]|nr:glycosyltransferase [Kiritimatiellia bacterium]
MNAKVSIIVPVYNVEGSLARCLDSVAGQTERGIEIVCVDDGSTDSSPDVLARYAARDPRIRVLRRVNGGLSAARNTGLDAAGGEWIMFVDSDDWIPSDAVAKMLSAAVESGLPVVASNGCAKDSLPAPRKPRVSWRRVEPALAGFVSNRRIHSSAWNKLYRRDAIGSRRFVEGLLFEDWPFNTELFADIPAFALVDEPMYVYSTGGASITRSPFGMRKAESYLGGIAHVERYFAGRPDRAVAARRIAVAVKMLVGKASKCGDAEVRRLVAAQDFSPYPLGLKTRFRLWRMRREAR